MDHGCHSRSAVPITQCDMILGMLRAAGSAGVSSLEITLATSIVNVTGRVSDLREQGHLVECFKVKSVNRYRLSGRPTSGDGSCISNVQGVRTLSSTDSPKLTVGSNPTCPTDDLIPRPTGYGVP